MFRINTESPFCFRNTGNYNHKHWSLVSEIFISRFPPYLVFHGIYVCKHEPIDANNYAQDAKFLLGFLLVTLDLQVIYPFIILFPTAQSKQRLLLQ